MIPITESSDLETKKAKFYNYYGAWVVNKYYQQYANQLNNQYLANIQNMKQVLSQTFNQQMLVSHPHKPNTIKSWQPYSDRFHSLHFLENVHLKSKRK